MNSLNAGAELDHEIDTTQPKEDQLAELVFDSPQDGEVPELDEHVTVITSMTEKLEQVTQLQDRIGAVGAIDQTVALEAHSLTDNFFQGPNTINTFTSFPTRTGLTYAMENLEKEKKNIIIRIYERLKEYLVRIIKWIGGLINRKPNPMDSKKVDEFFGKYLNENLKTANATVLVREKGKGIFDRLGDILKRQGLEDGIIESVAVFGEKVLERFEKDDQSFIKFRESFADNVAIVGMLNNSDHVKSLAKLTMAVSELAGTVNSLAEDMAVDTSKKESSSQRLISTKEFVAEVKKQISSLNSQVAEINNSFQRITNSDSGKRFSGAAETYTIADFIEDSHYLRKEVNESIGNSLEKIQKPFFELETGLTKFSRSADTIASIYSEDRYQNLDADSMEVVRLLGTTFREASSSVMESARQTGQLLREASTITSASRNFTAYSIRFVESINTFIRTLIASLPEKAKPEVTKYMEGLGFNLKD